MDSWIGRVLSKVRIERLIGRGGMADVYLGRHTTLNRPMAVKILHAHMTGDSDLRRRFRDEAQAVAALRHPNIVQVSDFDVADERPYIVMELLEGMALSDYLRGLHGLGHSLPLETVSRLTDSLTSALDYAHRRGIVHRDVKPANIILRAGASPIDPGEPLGAEVQPVLTDFGVARIATSTTPTASGTILGTPAYMSPEQVRGEAVDARSDIYSLGVILYEILAGKLPFDPTTETPASILYKHVHEDPPVLVGVSPGIRRVVNAALAKDPDDRYNQAGQMASDLSAAIAELPSEAAQELRHTQVLLASAAAPTPWTGGGRIRRPIAIAGGVLLAAAVLAGGVLLGSRMVRQAAGAPAETSSPTQSVPVVVESEVSVDAPPPSLPQTAEVEAPLGHAYVLGSQLELRMGGVPAPEQGQSYQAWLVGDEDVEPLNLNRDGRVEWIQGELLIEYAHPQDQSLIGPYAGLIVSSESAGSLLVAPTDVLYQAELDPALVAQARLASEVNPGTPVLSQLPELLRLQSVHFASHAGLALQAIADQNLAGARQHSEHTINIIEGREGQFFGDYDGDDQPVNPGDQVGLLPYLYLLEAAAQGASQSAQERGLSGEAASEVAQQAAELATAIAQARETARQIALADSVAAIQDLRLDAELLAARQLQEQIEQLAAEAASLDLSFALTLSAP